MRYGENTLSVMDGSKRKIDGVKSSLPTRASSPTYDRSELINRSIATLREKLIKNASSSPWSVSYFSGTSAPRWSRSSRCQLRSSPRHPHVLFASDEQHMSLGGIAIAIGAMIDAAIVMVENSHKSLEQFREEHGREPNNGERIEVIVAAAKTVGRPCFSRSSSSRSVFCRVFAHRQEGRLFKPLAFTKTFSMFLPRYSPSPWLQC